MGAATISTHNEDSQTGSMDTIVCSLWKWWQWFSVQQYRSWSKLSASLRPGNEKPVTWIPLPHFLQKEYILDSVLWEYRSIIHSQRYEKQLRDVCEDPKQVETIKQSFPLGEKVMFLQYNNTRPHSVKPLRQRYTSDLKLFHTTDTARIWHCLTPGCLQLSRNISKEFISHVMKKFKLLQ